MAPSMSLQSRNLRLLSVSKGITKLHVSDAIYLLTGGTIQYQQNCAETTKDLTVAPVAADK